MMNAALYYPIIIFIYIVFIFANFYVNLVISGTIYSVTRLKLGSDETYLSNYCSGINLCCNHTQSVQELTTSGLTFLSSGHRDRQCFRSRQR